MKQLLPIVLIILLQGLKTESHAQTDTNIVRLAGVIVSTDTAQKAPFVHVINTRTGKGVISDSLGIFKIRIQRFDTLLFQCLGFEDNYLQLPDTLNTNVCFIEVSLSPTSYQLKVIDILALTRQSQFKYDFTHLKVENKSWEKQIIIPGVTKEDYEFIKKEEELLPHQTFDGPITALYYKFSKEGKSLQKLEELMKEDKKEKAVDKKFNKNKLQQFTDYKNDTLDAFYNYLNFSLNYLHQTTTYAIFLKVSEKKKKFECDLKKGIVKIGPEFE